MLASLVKRGCLKRRRRWSHDPSPAKGCSPFPDRRAVGGGAGFAGPDLPIVRGAKKIREQQAAVGWNHDLVQFGHYHWSTNPANGRVLGNGSVPGYSEYASDLRAVVEPPQQWLYRLHSKWWMQERMPIQLADPTPPKMPRVRVPANFERVA